MASFAFSASSLEEKKMKAKCLDLPMKGYLVIVIWGTCAI